VEIVRKSEMVFGFMCDYCQKRWYVSSKLVLNDVLEEQIQKIHKFTTETEKEFGALLVKTPEGIRLDMIDIGSENDVALQRTKEYRQDEKVIGSAHCHPRSDEFSDWDIGTFLRDDWEKISIVIGAEHTINVMVKTSETLKVEDVKAFIEYVKDLSLEEKAEKFNFLLFKGKVNNLKLISGVSASPMASLEKLLKQIE
jgi:proteasome lid subunit RPN8/RPN11